MFDNRGHEPVNGRDVKRLRAAALALLLGVVLVLFESYRIQVWKRGQYTAIRPDDRRRTEWLAKRGVIRDRYGNPLATDLPSYTLSVDPTVMGGFRRASAVFAEALGGDRDHYLRLLSRNAQNEFVTVHRHVSEEQKAALEAAGLRGLLFNPSRLRIHPVGRVGLPVVGRINGDRRGISGIEMQFETVLSGENGWRFLQVDGRNRLHACADEFDRPPRDGRDVRLTLDPTLQTILEDELRRGLVRTKAAAGSAVLMNPANGEVLAMASLTAEDPSDEAVGSREGLQNRAVQAVFEPGSTLKVVTAAAALEEGVFEPESPIHCENGEFRFAGRVLHDHDKKYGKLSFSRVLEVSSNIGIAKVTRKLGRKRLYKSMQAFGFGTRTAVDLPGEAGGSLPPVYGWNDFTTAAIGFGQGISVTTLQVAGMMAAVANGGELLKPRIVLSVQESDGRETAPAQRDVLRRVLSPETAASLSEILERAVSQGSGTPAGVPGIRIAGKTGTAQKSAPGTRGYTPGLYTSSFAGFWPCEAPRFVLVVVLEEPRQEYYAASSAAPVFASVVQRIVGLPSSPRMIRRGGDALAGPSGPGRGASESAADGNARFVLASGEMPGGPRAAAPRRRRIETPAGTLPDLTGLSLREALTALAERKIEARVRGEGVVTAQSPEPGSRMAPGTVCFIACEPRRSGETAR
ncbi:transpeptidase family protein [bacterium]|nr:transpeptidase family protein [bacterium]